MSDTVNHARTFEVLTAEPVRRRRRPRDWSDDAKAWIVAASLQPGANVSAVARSEGLDHMLISAFLEVKLEKPLLLRWQRQLALVLCRAVNATRA